MDILDKIHLHTDASVLDGGQTVDDVINYAKENNIAVALTDHGNMVHAYKFYKKAKEQNVKAMIGCEMYMCRKYEDKDRYHIILIAKNNVGLHNLYKLQYEAYMKGFHSKPRVDMETLEKYSEGLVCTSACIGGIIPQAILKDDYDDALDLYNWFDSTFENFFIEIQPNNLDIQIKYNKWVESQNFSNVVIGCDAHYTNKEDKDIHDTLLCVQVNKKKDDKERFRFTVDAHMMNDVESREVLVNHGFSHDKVTSMINNTNMIKNLCDVSMEFEKYHIPVVSENSKMELAKLCNEGFKLRYEQGAYKGLNINEVVERIKYELKIIDQKGFNDYFLIVHDFLRESRERGIPVGVGRGSVAGSEVAYILRISELEPIRYGLLFERFLNPTRQTLVDIDSDFCYERRDEIIEYVSNKYGRDNVATLIAEGHMATSMVIRRVMSAYGYENSFITTVTNQYVPKRLNITLTEAYNESEKLREFLDSKPLIKRDCFKMEGLISHFSKHAAGVVITDKPVYEYIPVMRDSDNHSMLKSQWDKKQVENHGVVKYDFLGLKLLTVFGKTIRHTNRLNGTNLTLDDVYGLDLEDPNIYKVLNSGNLLGVFQFSEYAGKMTVLNAKPQTFEDIMACESICRPGVKEAEMFLKNKKEGYKRTGFKTLDNILEPTFGAIVYQEQTMMILYKIGGFTLGEADAMRKVKSLEPYRERFVENAKEVYKLSTNQANWIFNRLDLGLKIALIKHF